MKIEILGMGCPRCNALEQAVINACAELNLPVEIGKITNPKDFSKYGVFITPALVVDGEVVLRGRVASVGELKRILQARRGN